MSKLVKAAIAELFGTFDLVFIGALVVTIAGEPNGGVVAPALGHGLVLVVLAFTYGSISGGHFNPAVTAGMLVGGQIDIVRAVIYWVMQFLGAIIAAALVGAIAGAAGVASFGETTGTLTDTNLTLAAVIEFILAFTLVTTIYQTTVHKRAGDLAPIAIGFTLAALIFGAGVYTGGSVNPARTLGPALVAGDLSYVPMYFIGLFLGGITAGLFNAYVLTPDKD